jgi:hypothetical protein
MTRRFSAVVLVLVLAGSGCSSKEPEGSPNTALIREETTTVASSTEVASTVAVTSTIGSTAVVTAAEPKPVSDDFMGTVIVKAIPKTDSEREILEATVSLLANRRRLQLQYTNDRELLGTVMVGQALEEYLARWQPGVEYVSVPGKTDRFVVDSLRETSPDSAIVEVCEVNGAIAYKREQSGSLVLFNDDISTVLIEYQLVRTNSGWRLGYETIVDVLDRTDQCAS